MQNVDILVPQGMRGLFTAAKMGQLVREVHFIVQHDIQGRG
jgi:hypothetical protein